MKTNRFYLYFLLFALVAAATVSSCSDDDLWRANDNGAQLTEEGDFRLSTFPLYEDLWDIPYSVQSFDIMLQSHTDDSELRFEAECDHQYGGMNYITIRIPRDQLIPDSDYDMQGYLKKEYRGYSNGSHNLSLNQMNRGSYITRVIPGNCVQTLRINVQ